MWLKAKTPIKVSPTKTIPEGTVFEAEEHLSSLDDVDELKGIDAVEEAVPPQAEQAKADTDPETTGKGKGKK